MSTERAATTTILFSDLVGSTELMQRAGDDDAQRIFEAHYQLLRDAVDANGGAEVKSLGDGLMVAFNSAADAIRCATMMQQTSRRPVNGERLAIKVGLNAGDALRSERDYFGTAVVTARRLCDRAGPGQILCSALVEGLLAGRQAFSFRDLGDFELKGITAPVDTREVIYDTGQPGLLLTRTPFVGREGEMSRINAKLGEARSGRGALVLLVGEPGIGKSRMIEEFMEHARGDGAAVLFGASFEGEWVPPYAPFAEAIAGYVKDADPGALRRDLGYGGPPLARLVPALREALPDLPEPAPLQPDEERFRLLDAVSQFLIATSQRVPVVLVLDDLHWADKGTIAMLRHVAHFVTKHRILLLGAYRDVELDRQHPLSDALAALRREVEYERIALKGLDEDEVGALLTSITELDVPEAFVHAISEETDGNPFFIREVLLHLADEGKIYQQDGRWTTNVSIAEMGIPEGVRQVIGRRLSRLSDNANRLLTTASGFSGPFHIDLAGAAASLDEPAALDAIDEALQAQLLRSTGEADVYTFTHALIRHTLYGEMSPSRQVRLHRQIAEAMERVYGDRARDHAPELAYQYHRSAAIAGAERGVPHALAAADQAEIAAAWDEAVTFFRMALDLLTEDDVRLPPTLGLFAVALSWALRFEEAVETATRAADALVERGDANAAADFLADAAQALSEAGHVDGAWRLAAKGVLLKADRRDASWVRLRRFDLARLDAADPSYIGIMVMTPERLELDSVSGSLGLLALSPLTSREDVRKRARELHAEPFNEAVLTVFWLGDARRGSELWAALTDDSERSGKIALAAASCAQAARSFTALGLFGEGDRWLTRGLALADRVGVRTTAHMQLWGAQYERAVMTGQGWGRLSAEFGNTPSLAAQDVWLSAVSRSLMARGLAWARQAEPAIAQIAELVAALDLATGTAANYSVMACTAAEALWLLDRRDHIETVERNLRAKVVQPDLRYINVDGRLSLARLCALQGRYEEASRWFAEARTVLEEDGARPLRAIVDYDEALMYARRAADGDRERALPLLEAAMRQFSDIGMTGWTRLAEELRTSLSPP